MSTLSNSRTVLVTGGNRGIGLAVAQAFVAQGGYRVAATYRGAILREPGVLGVHCDITDMKSVGDAFDEVENEFGPVDVLVANAGITDDRLMLRMGEEPFQRVINTNLTGAWRCAQRATGPMARARWGRMIFVSSVVAMSGSAGQTNYAASKAGLIGLARSLARELGSRNVTSNVIAPGFVATDMTSVLPEERVASIRQQVPLRRLAAPIEIARVVTFLASEAAGYITGAVIPVDGGLGMGH